MRQICVNRQMVLDAIKNLNESCTTQEMANALSSPEKIIPERSVRAAVAWLILTGYLEKSTRLITRYDQNGDPYKVWLYNWTGKDTPISGKRCDGIRRNREEREIQKNWGGNEPAGVFLQTLFLTMKRKSK